MEKLAHESRQRKRLLTTTLLQKLDYPNNMDFCLQFSHLQLQDRMTLLRVKVEYLIKVIYWYNSELFARLGDQIFDPAPALLRAAEEIYRAFANLPGPYTTIFNAELAEIEQVKVAHRARKQKAYRQRAAIALQVEMAQVNARAIPRLRKPLTSDHLDKDLQKRKTWQALYERYRSSPAATAYEQSAAATEAWLATVVVADA